MSASVTAHALQPCRAFHSTLSTVLALDPPDLDCHFFALYTLPQSVIVDTYELIDRRLSFEFWGEPNLELPVFALDESASSLLLINATPTAVPPRQLALDIPLHARYAKPGAAQTSHHAVTISSPACFWACPPAGVSSAFSSKAPITNSTMLNSYAHFSAPSIPSHRASLEVPVASRRDLFPVEVGTTAVILMAFLWLVYCSWRTAVALQLCHLKEQ